MLFNSYGFLFLFLPLAVIGYRLLVTIAAPLISILWLSALSILFYAYSHSPHAWLIAISILFNYALGRAIAGAGEPIRRFLLIGGVAIDLAVLGYFKYSNFLVGEVAGLVWLDRGWTAVILPIGISFYTFTQIAYLADTYRHRGGERGLAVYTLFVTFFPHLIAGPILHHREMMPQFKMPRPAASGALFAGLAMLAIGLAKKTLLADPLGYVATTAYSQAAVAPIGMFTAWLASLCYALQIYFDFSAYSDMALGMAKMLGIDLPINFNSPYKATSIGGFWRRWHITLSRFLRDYLYIPLGGNRLGAARGHLNIFVTMVLGGIWHGAGWTFLVWGALHGAAQVIAKNWSRLAERYDFRMPHALAWVMTMTFVVVAWVPFRAHDMGAALDMWASLAGGHGFAVPTGSIWQPIADAAYLPVDLLEVSTTSLSVLIVALFIATLAPNSQQLLYRFDVGLESPGYGAAPRSARIPMTISPRWVVANGLLLGISLRSIGGYSEFIYFQF